jgi:hypothetical protein
MPEPWATLLPLAITSALFPIEAAITLLLLRSAGGVAKASAWVAGMTIVRLAQYAVLGGVLEAATDDGAAGTSAAEGAILLVVALLLLANAGRKAAKLGDADAPAPAWMTRLDGMGPRGSFAAAVAFLGLNPKHWAISLGAIGAVADAGRTGVDGWVAFLVFVLVAQSLYLAAVALAVAAPSTASRVLGGIAGALERHSTPIMVGVSAIFGVWFLAKALAAFGILGG